MNETQLFEKGNNVQWYTISSGWNIQTAMNAKQEQPTTQIDNWRIAKRYLADM